MAVTDSSNDDAHSVMYSSSDDSSNDNACTVHLTHHE